MMIDTQTQTHTFVHNLIRSSGKKITTNKKLLDSSNLNRYFVIQYSIHSILVCAILFFFCCCSFNVFSVYAKQPIFRYVWECTYQVMYIYIYWSYIVYILRAKKIKSLTQTNYTLPSTIATLGEKEWKTLIEREKEKGNERRKKRERKKNSKRNEKLHEKMCLRKYDV